MNEERRAVLDEGKVLTWTIREGVGVVLPLNGHLIELTKDTFGFRAQTELDLRIAKVYLEMALRRVDRALHGKLIETPTLDGRISRT